MKTSKKENENESLEYYLKIDKELKFVTLEETLKNPVLANDRRIKKNKIKILINKFRGKKKSIKLEKNKFIFDNSNEVLEMLCKEIEKPCYNWCDITLLDLWLPEFLRDDEADIDILFMAIHLIYSQSINIWFRNQIKCIENWSEINAKTIHYFNDLLNQIPLERKTEYSYNSSEEAYNALINSTNENFDSESLNSINFWLHEFIRDDVEFDILNADFLLLAINFMGTNNTLVHQWFFLQSGMPQNWNNKNFEIINIYNEFFCDLSNEFFNESSFINNEKAKIEFKNIDNNVLDDCKMINILKTENCKLSKSENLQKDFILSNYNDIKKIISEYADKNGFLYIILNNNLELEDVNIKFIEGDFDKENYFYLTKNEYVNVSSEKVTDCYFIYCKICWSDINLPDWNMKQLVLVYNNNPEENDFEILNNIF